MKVGVNLINFGPSASADVLRRWARLVEALGYHSLMTSDHVTVTPDVAKRYPAPLFEPISTLGWLTGITERIAIGDDGAHPSLPQPAGNGAGICEYRPAERRPVHSRRRRRLGAGGIRRAERAVREARRDRRTNILPRSNELWTEDVASFDGEFVRFTDVDTAPRPAQSPHPPIWVGGPSDAAMRRAIRYGDAWHPIRIREDWFRDEGIPRLAELADREGKPDAGALSRASACG